jgi:hypothetical protein
MRKEVTRDWRRLHNDGLRNLYASSYIIRAIKSRKMRLAEHAARMGEIGKRIKILVGKPEGKRPLGRPRRGWEMIFRMDITEMGWEVVDWIHLAQDRDK